jgi:hypothetical protein
MAHGMPAAPAAVFLNLERVGPTTFNGVAQPVKRPYPRIPAPGEDQFPGAPTADHLVVQQIRCHPDQGEVGETLTDDFVAGSKRDEMGETLERDAVARLDQAGHSFGQVQEFAHRRDRQPTALSRNRGGYPSGKRTVKRLSA